MSILQLYNTFILLFISIGDPTFIVNNLLIFCTLFLNPNLIRPLPFFLSYSDLYLSNNDLLNEEHSEKRKLRLGSFPWWWEQRRL